MLNCGSLSWHAAHCGEVKQMKLFTSIATIAGPLGKRDDGQSLPTEIVAMTLLVFAFFGVMWLFKTVA
jgi:hypothetical protein